MDDVMFLCQGQRWPNNRYVVGLLDKNSHRIFEPNLESILHLGGYAAQVFRTDKFADDHAFGKMRVLGEPAPALFFYNLKRYDAMTAAQK